MSSLTSASIAREVSSPKAGVGTPFVGLWAITNPGGRNDFTIPCATFYVGDYEKVPFQTVVRPDRLKRHVRTSKKDLTLTFRVNVVGQEGAKVKVEEFIPVELVEPVAEVLKWVKSLNDAKKEEAELDSVEL